LAFVPWLAITACFTDSSNAATSADSTATASDSETTTDSTAADQTSQSTSNDATSQGSATSTTNGDETGPDPICGERTCLAIPGGWQGPFVAELGGPTQCDDTSFALGYVGIDAAWADGDACECNCSSETPVTCQMEVLVGGDPDTCTDNALVAQRCESSLDTWDVACDGEPSGCVPLTEYTSYRAFYGCSAGTGNVLHPIWAGGFRMCNADDAVGSPCNGGQCGDPSRALCLLEEGAGLQCPPSFPHRIEGWASFATNNVQCQCECTDPGECAYSTWHEGGVCTGAGGDDDPACSTPASASSADNAIEFLSYQQAPQGCEPAPDPAEPAFPLAEPLTVCCTIAL
jgi:hypothetical protein